MFKSILSLTRYKLSLSVAFSGLVGFLYFKTYLEISGILTFCGIFFLACGASALNQVQEKKYDLKMARTSKRPIPMKLIRPSSATLISFFLIFLGLFLLLYAGNIICLFLGFLSIFWYNGLYTILKRKTAFAVFPGSFTGVFPIVIGWYAAGGNWVDIELIFISFFMVLWQIPHFLLLMLHYNDDYKKADFPTFSDLLNNQQIKRLILTWVTCTILASFMLLLFNIITPIILKSVLVALGMILIGIFLNEILRKKEIKYSVLFASINGYMICVMILLTISRVF